MPNLKKDFIELCKENKYLKKDIETFEKAINFAEKSLENKKHLSGRLIIEHNIAIGIVLVKTKLSPEVITAGLLYGIEKYNFVRAIQKEFGKDVTNLVFGQAQLKVIRSKNKFAEAETLRKILITTLNDPRVILVKLANKLDHLKNISVFELKEQKRIAQEVLDIYSPLALRLGAEYIRRNLEEESFKIIYPKKYNEICKFLKESQEERRKFIEKLTEKVSKLFKEKVKILNIKGREKNVYSIFKKFTERKIPLNEQKDHFAIRILVYSIQDCYNVLGILHENYKNDSGNLKDYIAHPKLNNYQSIHTLLEIFGKKVEVQIRTLEMDEFAEEGGAAHWKYKKLNSDEKFEKKTAWLRNIMDLQSDGNTNLKDIKLNLFGEGIYCYTPLGKSIYLPKDSTILDFAYHIHQEVGNRSIGGRINGIFAPLKKVLNSGDVIEIITNKSQRPRRDWIKIVVSARAKNFIKKEVKRIENLPVCKFYHSKKEEKENFDSLIESSEFPNHIFDLAKCCYPIPGEEIVGVLKSSKRILIHKKNCNEIRKNENVFPASWKEYFNRPLKINVHATDRSGILADILNTIVSEGFIVKKAQAKLGGDSTSECSFVIVPKELKEIIKISNRIKKVRGVKRIWFE